MTKQRCDKCGAKTDVRYQCENQWVCAGCFPAKQAREMYPQWDREKRDKKHA